MASYTELFDLFDDATMLGRVTTAVVIAANDKLTSGSATAAERKWASTTLYNPRGEAGKAFRLVLASNQGASVAQILGASDTVIQTQVNNVVDELILAMSGQ